MATYDIVLRNPGSPYNIVLADAVAGSPFLIMVRGDDARTLTCFLSEEVIEADMKILANYLITGPTSVSVTAVTKLTAQSYRLTTTEMARNASYTLRISNVRDLEGNLT